MSPVQLWLTTNLDQIQYFFFNCSLENPFHLDKEKHKGPRKSIYYVTLSVQSAYDLLECQLYFCCNQYP